MARIIVKKETTDPPVRQIIKAESPQDNTADVRDIMANLVGGGKTGLTDADSRANFASLTKLVGAPAAQKLVSQAFLFNQRPGAAQLPAAARLQQFYDTGSNDPEVSGHLKKIKAFGSGVLGGLNTSPNIGSMLLSGREPLMASKGLATPVVPAAVAKILAKSR